VDLLKKLHDSDRIFPKTALVLIAMRNVAEALVEINGSRLAMKKLGALRDEFSKREERRKLEAKQQQMKIRGKADVILRDRRNAPAAPFWERGPIRFSPNWVLTYDKPDENLTKEQAMNWLASVYL